VTDALVRGAGIVAALLVDLWPYLLGGYLLDCLVRVRPGERILHLGPGPGTPRLGRGHRWQLAGILPTDRPRSVVAAARLVTPGGVFVPDLSSGHPLARGDGTRARFTPHAPDEDGARRVLTGELGPGAIATEVAIAGPRRRVEALGVALVVLTVALVALVEIRGEIEITARILAASIVATGVAALVASEGLVRALGRADVAIPPGVRLALWIYPVSLVHAAPRLTRHLHLGRDPLRVAHDLADDGVHARLALEEEATAAAARRTVPEEEVAAAAWRWYWDARTSAIEGEGIGLTRIPPGIRARAGAGAVVLCPLCLGGYPDPREECPGCRVPLRPVEPVTGAG